MSDFKLKINLAGANIELEGEGELVKELLLDLKTNGLGKLTKICTSDQSDKNLISEKIKDNNDIQNLQENYQETSSLQSDKNYPAIKDIFLRNPSKSGPKKILVCVAHALNLGKDFVLKDDIKQYLKSSGSWNKTISSNFNSYINSLIINKCLSTHNDNGYNLTEKGKQEAENIIFDKCNIEDTTNKTAKRMRNKNGNKPSKQVSIPDLNLSAEEQDSFADFYFKRPHETHTDKVTLIAYWLKKNKSIEAIDQHKISQLLTSIGESASFKISDALNNAKKQKKYLVSTGSKGEYRITKLGLEHVEKDLSAKE